MSLPALGGLRRVDAKFAKATRNFRERPDALTCFLDFGSVGLLGSIGATGRLSMSRIVKVNVHNCQCFRRERSSTIFASLRQSLLAEPHRQA